LKCIDFVSKYGWLFLPNYSFSKVTAEWTYRLESEIEFENWLSDFGKIKSVNFERSENFDFSMEESQNQLIKTIKTYKFIYGKS